MEQVFVEKGDRYVPLQRFNLKAARASTAFDTGKKSEGNFEVRRNRIVQSISAGSRLNTSTGTRSSSSSVTRPSAIAGSRPSSSAAAISASRPSSSTISRPTTEEVKAKPVPEVKTPKPTTDVNTKPEPEVKVSRATLEEVRVRPRPEVKTSRPIITRPSSEVRKAYCYKIIGQIVNALLNEKLHALEPEYPVIDDESQLSCNTKLACVDGSYCMIPDVHLTPFDYSRLFYYEDVDNGEGKPAGYVGYVSLSYSFTSTDKSVRELPVDVDSVKLHLKTNNNSYVIDGSVDHQQRCITISLKNEAVKIAFCNLGSQIDEMKCDIDIYYRFSGYSIEKTPIKIYRPLSRSSEKMLTIQQLRMNRPVVLQSVARERLVVKKTAPLYVKSSFIVKAKKTLSYPLNKYGELYQCFSGTISGNPFKLNDDFSEYQKITGLSVKFRELVDVYKSLFSKNSFLLFPKRYYLARNAERACIYSTCFLNEEGVTEKEQEISKVGFSFDVAPVLSEYELAELKMELYENNLLDTGFGEEKRKRIILDEVNFNFPNDVGAECRISGDDFFNNASIVKDGQYFNVICETENLGTASMFITSINSAYPRFFNIESKYKDLHSSAVVELDMNKTIGEFLDWQMSDGTITIINNSYSPCRISELMLFNNEGKCFLNDEYFSDSECLESFQSTTVRIKDLVSNRDFQEPEILFFKYESVEDINKEFLQEIDQTTAYYRNIVLDFSGIDGDVASAEIDIKHISTGYRYSFKKERKHFDQFLNLMLITKNEVEPVTRLEIARKYRSDNGQILLEDTLEWDYSDSTLIDLS